MYKPASFTHDLETAELDWGGGGHLKERRPSPPPPTLQIPVSIHSTQTLPFLLQFFFFTLAVLFTFSFFLPVFYYIIDVNLTWTLFLGLDPICLDGV